MLVYTNSPGGIGFLSPNSLLSEPVKRMPKAINKKVIKHPFHLTLAKKRVEKLKKTAVMPSVLLNEIAENAVPDWRTVTALVPSAIRLLDVNESRADKAFIFNKEVLPNKRISDTAKKFLRKMVNEFSYSDNLTPIDVPLEKHLERYRLLSGGHDLESELRDRRIIMGRPEPLSFVVDDVFNDAAIKHAIRSGYTSAEIGEIVRKLYNGSTKDEADVIAQMDRKFREHRELEKERQRLEHEKIREEESLQRELEKERQRLEHEKIREEEALQRELATAMQSVLMPELRRTTASTYGSDSIVRSRRPSENNDEIYMPAQDIGTVPEGFDSKDIEFGRGVDAEAERLAADLSPFGIGLQPSEQLAMIRQQDPFRDSDLLNDGPKPTYSVASIGDYPDMSDLPPPLETTVEYTGPDQTIIQPVTVEGQGEPVYTGQSTAATIPMPENVVAVDDPMFSNIQQSIPKERIAELVSNPLTRPTETDAPELNTNAGSATIAPGAQIPTDIVLGDVPLSMKPGGGLGGDHKAAVDETALTAAQMKETDPIASAVAIAKEQTPISQQREPTAAPGTVDITLAEKQHDDRLLQAVSDKIGVQSLNRLYLDPPSLIDDITDDNVEDYIKYLARYNAIKKRFADQGIFNPSDKKKKDKLSALLKKQPREEIATTEQDLQEEYRRIVSKLSDSYPEFKEIERELIGTDEGKIKGTVKAKKLILIDDALKKIDIRLTRVDDEGIRYPLTNEFRSYIPVAHQTAAKVFTDPKIDFKLRPIVN